MRRLLAFSVVYALPALSVPLPAARVGVVTRLPRPTDRVALTFDDGPHPEGTEAVLDALGAAGLTATFFVSAPQVRRSPALIAKLLAAGHEVGSHGNRHRPHALLPPGLVERDLAHAVDELEQVAGRPVTAIRAPYGAASLASVRFARRRGVQLVGWTRWGWDWTSGATAASIARHATRSLDGGEIILLHDSDAYGAPGSWRATAAAIPLIARELELRRLTATARL